MGTQGALSTVLVVRRILRTTRAETLIRGSHRKAGLAGVEITSIGRGVLGAPEPATQALTQVCFALCVLVQGLRLGSESHGVHDGLIMSLPTRRKRRAFGHGLPLGKANTFRVLCPAEEALHLQKYRGVGVEEGLDGLVRKPLGRLHTLILDQQESLGVSVKERLDGCVRGFLCWFLALGVQEHHGVAMKDLLNRRVRKPLGPDFARHAVLTVAQHTRGADPPLRLAAGCRLLGFNCVSPALDFAGTPAALQAGGTLTGRKLVSGCAFGWWNANAHVNATEASSIVRNIVCADATPRASLRWGLLKPQSKKNKSVIPLSLFREIHAEIIISVAPRSF